MEAYGDITCPDRGLRKIRVIVAAWRDIDFGYFDDISVIERLKSGSIIKNQDINTTVRVSYVFDRPGHS